MELEHFGAPNELVSWAHFFAEDEVRHARICLNRARVLGASFESSCVLDALDGHTMELEHRPQPFAERTAVDGCIGETVSLFMCDKQANLFRETDAEAYRL